MSCKQVDGTNKCNENSWFWTSVFARKSEPTPKKKSEPTPEKKSASTHVSDPKQVLNYEYTSFNTMPDEIKKYRQSCNFLITISRSSEHMKTEKFELVDNDNESACINYLKFLAHLNNEDYYDEGKGYAKDILSALANYNYYARRKSKYY